MSTHLIIYMPRGTRFEMLTNEEEERLLYKCAALGTADVVEINYWLLHSGASATVGCALLVETGSTWL